MLNNCYSNQTWFAKTHLQANVVIDGNCMKINGILKHHNYFCEPWADLTCTNCVIIPLELDF